MIQRHSRLFIHFIFPHVHKRIYILTHWDRDKATAILLAIFSNEFFIELWISLKISLTFVPKVRFNNVVALVQIMAWRRPGDKPLSDPMMVRLLRHVCVTRPEWVKHRRSTSLKRKLWWNKIMSRNVNTSRDSISSHTFQHYINICYRTACSVAFKILAEVIYLGLFVFVPYRKYTHGNFYQGHFLLLSVI